MMSRSDREKPLDSVHYLLQSAVRGRKGIQWSVTLDFGMHKARLAYRTKSVLCLESQPVHRLLQRRALESLVNKEQLTPTWDRWIAELKVVEKEYHSIAPQDFTVLLPLHIGLKGGKAIDAFSAIGIRSDFVSWDQVKAQAGWSELAAIIQGQQQEMGISLDQWCKHYIASLKEVQAPFPDAAFRQAEREHQIDRAILNLVLRGGTRTIMSTHIPGKRPLAVCLPSPFYAIFSSSGALEDTYFSPDLPCRVMTPRALSRAQLDSIGCHLAEFAELPPDTRTFVEDIVLAYGDAVDTLSPFVRLVTMFRVLETAANPLNKILSLQKIVSRVSTLNHLSGTWYDLLDQIRLVRNAAVHREAFDWEDDETNEWLHLLAVTTIRRIVEISRELGSRKAIEELLVQPRV